MEERLYSPLNKEHLHIWDYTCTIIYQKACIKLKYETEPPHGGFIYSVKITIDEAEGLFPFWIYGRNVFFYDNYIVMEGMKSNEGYRPPLHTVIINLVSKQYTEIKDWYCDFCAENGILILKNKYTKVDIELKNPERLDWYPIFMK
ncbi:MAG TPA: hypothetical protein VF941_23410 [Clostridia bacterium]